MAKLTAWVVTIIGLLLLLNVVDILPAITAYNGWLIAIGVLVIGIGKLARNYNIKKKKR